MNKQSFSAKWVIQFKQQLKHCGVLMLENPEVTIKAKNKRLGIIGDKKEPVSALQVSRFYS